MPLPSCAIRGRSGISRKGPLEWCEPAMLTVVGAGSPLLRPVPLLPFSNTSCGFLMRREVRSIAHRLGRGVLGPKGDVGL